MQTLKPKTAIGILFALTAAALNASIGIFSKVLMAYGLIAQDIAFIKTLLAFLLLSLLLFARPLKTPPQRLHKADNAQATTSKTALLIQMALCAFFGIFVLFFFETAAYKHGFASYVVVVLMAAAAISALMFERILLGERILPSAIMGVFLAIGGIGIIALSEHGGGGGFSLLMFINAAIAGAGYGLFSVLVRKFGLIGGLGLTRVLMGFGSVFLFVPFVLNMHPIDVNFAIIANLIALAILPTIVGFFCTTKALMHLNAGKVQVIELSEPIFATLLGVLVVNEMPQRSFFVGAVLIVLGILLINQIHRALLSNK